MPIPGEMAGACSRRRRSSSSSSGRTSGFAVDPVTEARRLAGYDVLRVRANNPGPLTLSGTNTWIVDRNPAYVIDPGPELEDHLRRCWPPSTRGAGSGASR